VDVPWHPELLFEIADLNPTAAIDLLAVVREWGGPKWSLNYLGDFAHLSFPHRSFFRTRQRDPEAPEALLTRFQIIKALTTESSRVEFDDHLLMRMSEEEVLQSFERNPERAFGFLHAILETKESTWMERHGATIFRRALGAIDLADLVIHAPALLCAAIRLIRFFKDGDALDKAVREMELFLKEKDAIPRMSKQLTLETLPELRWLAQSSGTRGTRLNVALDTILAVPTTV
jgi:hypothetical protein